MHDQIEQILIDRQTIAARVDELGEQLDRDLHQLLQSGHATIDPQAVTLVAIMTGSIVFLSDLIRRLTVPLRLRLISIRSYPGTAMTSQGPKLDTPLPSDLNGRHVVIIDDIIDSGRTISLVREDFETQRPASLSVCALLRKRIPPAMTVKAEYIGFEIPDAFVVGYGLDHDGLYRNLPDIVTLKPITPTTDRDR